MDSPSPMVKTARGYMLRSQVRLEGEVLKIRRRESIEARNEIMGRTSSKP